MNPIVAEVTRQSPPGWSRRRWLLTLSGIFLAQLALVFLFQQGGHTPPKKPTPATDYRLEPSILTSRQIARSFFTVDPTLYSSASLHSFSGPAWLRLEPPGYTFPSSERPANWLKINTNQLGQAPIGLSRLSSPLQTLPVASPKLELLLNYLVPDTVRTQSLVTLDGDLIARASETTRTIPPWTSSDMISNSVVELAADACGQVISVRLTGHCGSPEADRQALKIARNMVFAPVAAEVGGRPITAGTLTFQWQTVLPPDTNSPPKG
jgi:hypothetical protein